MAENYLEKQISRRSTLQMLSGGAGFALMGGGAMALLSACDANTGGGGGSGQIAIGLFAEPDSLDPATMHLLPSYQVTSSIYDQLLWKLAGQSSDSFLPGLATSYRVSPDGKSFTFKLRKGVTFHDGTRFDASAVKANFDRIVAPATKSASAKAVLGPYHSSTVVDDYTVRVDFTAANGAFLNNVASPLLAIVSPTAARKKGSLARHPVGTGPFKFGSWVTGESIQLTRNEKYTWGPDTAGLQGPAKLTQVTFRIVTSSPSQANALQSGGLQVAQGMDIADLERVTKAGFRQRVVGASGVPFGFVLNVHVAPTDDLRVRQAIQYATDAKAINSTVFSNVYKSANTVLTSATFGHSTKVTYSYQPDRAASLLDQAGWTMGSGGVRRKNGKPLHLSWLLESGGFGFEDAAELMTSQLEKAGISSQITQAATPEYVAGIEAGKMNVSGLYDYAADPYVLNTLFSCAQVGDGPNNSHFCSHQVDASIAAALGTTGAGARATAYEAIQDKLMQEAMFVPIYNTAAVFATAKSVSGITYTPLAVPLLTGATA